MDVLRRGRDALTGAVSIESFRTRLGDEIVRAKRHDLAGSLAVLQVDRLDELHHEHGYEAGDALFRSLVGALRRATRPEDLVARAGDGRFALLLRDCDEHEAQACVQRLLLELERRESAPVTASVGIAPLRIGESPVELFDHAERALADAQAAGGGRAVTASASEAVQAEVVEAIQRRDAIEALAIALLERDRYTGEHSESVVEMARAVARTLGLAPAQVGDVRAAALLHDIGKVGIPDAILHKPGPLTHEERAVMAEHPVIGERILRGIGGFAHVARIVRHEHESWDGSGYPDGLAGEQIPVGSRIILACDAYHAMTSDRPYRERMTHADAFGELARGAGSQFDPEVTESLIGHLYNERAGRLTAVG